MSGANGQEFLTHLAGIRHDLPYSPELLQKLFAQTGEDSLSSLDDVAGTISNDQGLTTKVLSLANSAFYGLRAQVSSVSRAIAVLGLVEVRNIVLMLGVKHLSRGFELPAGFDLVEYWTHQVAVGMIAKKIARMQREAAPESIFTAGLLHDLGKLITAMHRPKDWLAIEALSRKNGLSFHEAEDRYWGFDHSVVGALVLRSWDLPADLTEPVNWHHFPEAAPDHSREAGIVCLADQLFYQASAEHEEYDTGPDFSPAVTRDLSQELGLDSGDAFGSAMDVVAGKEYDRLVSHLI